MGQLAFIKTFILVTMPIDANGVVVPLSEEEKSRIVVFNEEFVEKQIRFQQEGLETVVVLGAAVDVEEQLNEAIDRLSDLKDKKSEILLQLMTNQ